MPSINKVILIGHLGKDPELKFTPSGQPVANFSVATSEKWTGKDGNPGEKTEWHRIVVWGKTAENCKQYLFKGSAVYLEGKLQTREWENKEGQKQRTTEIVAHSVQFLGGGKTKKTDEVSAEDVKEIFGADESDIPF
jgi:single-strand DNA-binding protein